MEFRACRRRLPREIIADLLRTFLRGRVSHCRTAHFHHRRKRAATEAGDLFDGELLRRIGVGARRNAQAPSQCVLHPLRARDMASRAAADAENMFARRLVAKHIVESRNTGDGGGLNLGQLAEAHQDFLGKVAMMLLERLQNRDQRLGFAPDALHRFFDKFEVHARHTSWCLANLMPAGPRQ